MSQRPATSRPSSLSPHDRSKPLRLPSLESRTLPPIQNTNRPGSLQLGAQATSTTQDVSGRSSNPQSSTPPDQRSSRPIGMQNLLNPTTGGDIANSQNRRRNVDHMDSPPQASPHIAIPRVSTPSLPAPSMINRSLSNVSLPSITPPSNGFTQSSARAMTPRSPSGHGPGPITRNIPSATIDVKQAPFVPFPDHTSVGFPDTASAAPMQREGPYGSILAANHSPPDRRGSQDSTRYNRMQNFCERTGGVSTGPQSAASQCDSPSTQYSSYSHVSPTPPAASSQPTAPPSTTGQPQSFFTTPFTAPGPASMAPIGFDAPASSSATGGSTYQMMTLDTEQGPIQVPVDVQAASKVADEKRKRNATASHRFRQRRKEKERETSQNIAKLEQLIREVTAEREYYKRERDYFRDVAVRNPGHAHIVLPRPLSPGQRRHTSLGAPAGFPSLQFQSPEDGNRNGGRNTRRRTSAYVQPTGPPPLSSELAPPMNMPGFERAPNLSESTHGSERVRLQGASPLSNHPTGSYNGPSTTR